MRAAITGKNVKYSGYTIILSFFVFSLVGWVLEGVYVGWSYGVFLNRGFLHGPWLPIYGTGSVLMFLLMNRFRSHPAAVFLGSALICGVVEYVTSLTLELVFHQSWWDYSQCFMNFQGRICLPNLLLFGAAGVFLVYCGEPLLERGIDRLPPAVRRGACLLLCALFAADTVFSMMLPNAGVGITS